MRKYAFLWCDRGYLEHPWKLNKMTKRKIDPTQIPHSILRVARGQFGANLLGLLGASYDMIAICIWDKCVCIGSQNQQKPVQDVPIFLISAIVVVLLRFTCDPTSIVAIICVNKYTIIFRFVDRIPSSANIPVEPWNRCVHSLLEHTDVTIMYATCLWISPHFLLSVAG
jgi:hypothetical protein